jgi:hypothetical protein
MSSGLKFERDANQLRIAFDAAEQIGAKTAAVRWRFIARGALNEASPPMARMLRGSGGRGGSTRLKLYLSLLWLARGREHPVFAYPAQQLATLLGLPNPSSAGSRRIQDALKWLEQNGFVAVERRPGVAARVHLLDDAGTGHRYEKPGVVFASKAKRTGKAAAQRELHYYVQLPRAFWTEGWVAELSGAAVAMYLAVLREQRGRDGLAVWISPSVGVEQYDLSDESRGKGLRELVDFDLLHLERHAVPQSSFDERYRARNVYYVNPNGLRAVHGRTRAEAAAEDSLNLANRRRRHRPRLPESDLDDDLFG